MKKFENWDKVEAKIPGEFETLKPGGYICKILQVKAEENDGTKSYDTLLRIFFDIAEGEYKDYFKKQFERRKEQNPDAKWPGMYYQPVKADDLGYFKGFITAIEKSNPGYKWNWDEKTLVGKLFGGIFGEEEYEGNDGSIKTKVRCRFIRSVDTVRSGDFKIPELKPLKLKNTSSYTSTENKSFEELLNNDDGFPF